MSIRMAAVACLLFAISRAFAADASCPPGPFALTPPAAAPNRWAGPAGVHSLARVYREVPPEIARIGDGVIYVSQGMSPGGSDFHQDWTAYDAQRRLFVAVRRHLLDRPRALGHVPLHRNQIARQVREKTLYHFEIVTLIAADPARSAQIGCLGNRALAAISVLPRIRYLPPADAWQYLDIVSDGKTVRGHADDRRLGGRIDDVAHYLTPLFPS